MQEMFIYGTLYKNAQICFVLICLSSATEEDQMEVHVNAK